MEKRILKLRKVKLHILETDLEGYIRRPENEGKTRHNTWNGWEIPYFTVEQVKAWLPTQDEWYDNVGPGGVDKWELKFNEETQKHELWIYDVDNCKFEDDWVTEGEKGFVKTEYGIFTDEIIYTLFDAETYDGEKIEVFASPCYTWELARGED